MGIRLETVAFVKAACCSAACYAITKTCRYLCTRPVIEAGKVATIFDRFRQKCAGIQESISQYIGKKYWETFSEVVMDNMWISTFVISSFFFLATAFPPCSGELIGHMALVCVAITHLSATIRQILFNSYPGSEIVKTWIAPVWEE